jgi:hypothetical protein
MPNTNYLAGMQCPTCGSEGPFFIEVTATVEVHDSYIDLDAYPDDCTWLAYSPCECDACGANGMVEEFRSPVPTPGGAPA